MKTKIELKMGSFYEDRDGSTWCCFIVDPTKDLHCQARCIKIMSDRVEYFYVDGRYDEKGLREHTLIRELTQEVVSARLSVLNS